MRVFVCFVQRNAVLVACTSVLWNCPLSLSRCVMALPPVRMQHGPVQHTTHSSTLRSWPVESESEHKHGLRDDSTVTHSTVTLGLIGYYWLIKLAIQMAQRHSNYSHELLWKMNWSILYPKIVKGLVLTEDLVFLLPPCDEIDFIVK